jgi:hypothetical protein
MLKPWLKKTLQIVGTLALVALVVVVYRRTDWHKGFTPDGVMTLIAGVLAFAAVQWQIWDQRRAAHREQDRQKRAVATALLFEIDGFYRSYLRDPRKFWAHIDPKKDALPGVRSVGENPFPVYGGNASKIGELENYNVQGIVHFYGEANSYLSMLRDYRNALEAISYLATSLSITQRSSEGPPWLVREGEARAHLSRLKQAVPELIKFAWLVCYYLCRDTGTEFKFPTIGVAAEPLSIKDFEPSPDNDTGLGANSSKLK